MLYGLKALLVVSNNDRKLFIEVEHESKKQRATKRVFSLRNLRVLFTYNRDEVDNIIRRGLQCQNVCCASEIRTDDQGQRLNFIRASNTRLSE